jgi:hypothetical protein
MTRSLSMIFFRSLCFVLSVLIGFTLIRQWRASSVDSLPAVPAQTAATASPASAPVKSMPDPAVLLAQRMPQLDDLTNPGPALLSLKRDFGFGWSKGFAVAWALRNPAEFAGWLQSAAALGLHFQERLELAELLYYNWSLSDPVTAWKSMETLGSQEGKAWLDELKGTVIAGAASKAPRTLLAIAPLLAASDDFKFRLRLNDQPSDELLSTLRALPAGHLREAGIESLLKEWQHRAGSDPAKQRMLSFWRELATADKKLLDLNDLTPVLHLLEPDEFQAVLANTSYTQFDLQYWLSKRLGKTAPEDWSQYKKTFPPRLFREAASTAIRYAVQNDQWDAAVALAKQLGSNEDQREALLSALKSHLDTPDMAAWLQQPETPLDWKQAGLEQIAGEWAGKLPEDFLTWSAAAPREWLTPDFLSAASETLGEHDAERWWRWQRAVADHPKAAAAMKGSLWEIARKNGPQAIKLMNQLPAETQQTLFPMVIKTWHSYDSTGVQSWLKNQEASRQTAVGVILHENGGN